MSQPSPGGGSGSATADEDVCRPRPVDRVDFADGPVAPPGSAR